jgi:hypothetical protein
MKRLLILLLLAGCVATKYATKYRLNKDGKEVGYCVVDSTFNGKDTYLYNCLYNAFKSKQQNIEVDFLNLEKKTPNKHTGKVIKGEDYILSETQIRSCSYLIPIKELNITLEVGRRLVKGYDGDNVLYYTIYHEGIFDKEACNKPIN